MAEDATGESSREIEVYGELGILPKAGVKIRLTRKARVDRVITSAAGHAELDPGQLQERLADSDDRLRDVVVMAALRAEQVDDDQYLDMLGRLIAGALDPAKIDELAFITSEITKLEPIHLRALMGFFHFGRQGEENADSDLSPADAAWATDRHRVDREIAYLLHMTREATAQVLLRLGRDGFIHLGEGPRDGSETTSVPSDWAGRVLSILFPALKVEFDDTSATRAVGKQVRTGTTKATSTPAVVALRDPDPSTREHRAISELEEEIKKSERLRHSPLARDPLGGDVAWLATMKRRLRRIDPDNPWAYDD